MTYTDQDYIETHLFPGDESEISCRTVAIKTAAKEHSCFFGLGRDEHKIAKGERYRHEKARVDGSFWGEYRCCLRCIEKQIEGDYE